MKRLITITLIFFAVLNIKGVAQTIDYNSILPVDETIKKGVLPNGMTYYIKSTDVVKGAASYYIIQNVGSILENDDQQGLAHFLEHMAFNGTKHFPGKGILNTLQKHGAVFGKDINAYTSFDETVYNLNNIPTKDGLVDICLTVLEDWSHYLLLTNEEIDAERGVIKEERRTRQSGQMRMFESSAPIVYNNSKYVNRLPIGLMSVVENFDYKVLRDFYHDWYRTDLQAIAIIGDVDVKDIEQKIIENFSKIPAVENPKERFVVDIPENEEMLYSLGTDPEVSTASISFGIRHKKSLKIETVETFKESLLEQIALRMLSARISEKSQNPEASFLRASLKFSSLSRTSNLFSLNVTPKLNKQQEAFKEVFKEVMRAIKHGFVTAEIDRTKIIYLNNYENKIAKYNDRSHRNIIGDIQDNYLNNKPITDIKKEYELVKQILSTVNGDEIQNALKKLYTPNNRFLNVTGVESQKNLTKTQGLEIIKTIETSEDIEPYKEELVDQSLLSSIEIKPGTIINTSTKNSVGATTFFLSNGVKVHYKFVDKNKNEVSLEALSYGGNSLLEDEELPSAGMVTSLLQRSGLAKFNSTDLKKILAGKTVSMRLGLNDISESIFGSSSTKDVETMLQLVHAYFVKPRFDEEAYKVLKSRLNNNLQRRVNHIGSKINDSITVALYGKNNTRKRIYNQDYINDISFEKIKTIYKERFSDASDFEFFIVGDVKEAQLKPLLKQYLASIPTWNTKEIYKDNGPEWISDQIDKDIYLKMEEPKANINIAYKKEMPYSKSNEIYTNALGDILQLRITESIREAEGGAYSPAVGASFSKEPKSQAYVSFRFDCNPEMADNLVNIAKGELENISKGNIKEDDLNKTKTNFIKKREQSKDKNGYDMSVLVNYFRYDTDINDPKNFEKIVNGMTKKHIQKIAKEVLTGSVWYEIVFKPEQ
ncbi:pitrilysin family protein [Flavivirga sp. 57AJ16]|uniref:M16 family metallopeptidase n=1 Tax=Flavivirga sp. 57AJ16 TaxID=3025307 RepID=UPI002366826F|nr:M16 family metallopeptidase [Flavivirga sp. 57AJ16]MDD7886789.1 insulinase family protein [Flavivirga sp. 57AJ16]